MSSPPSLRERANNVVPTPAAIAVVAREGRLLLVRRANRPGHGLWGFPGGRIEAGETIEAAAERELREETGVRAAAERILTAFDVIEHDEAGRLSHHFVLIAVGCRWLRGEARAADDAIDARWFTVDEIHALGVGASPRTEAVARLFLNE